VSNEEGVLSEYLGYECACFRVLEVRNVGCEEVYGECEGWVEKRKWECEGSGEHSCEPAENEWEEETKDGGWDDCQKVFELKSRGGGNYYKNTRPEQAKKYEVKHGFSPREGIIGFSYQFEGLKAIE